MGKAHPISNEMRKYLKQLGYRIGYLRRCHEISQEELAEAIGYSQSYLARIEANTGQKPTKPSLDFLLDTAHYFGIPLEELVKEEPVRTTKKRKRK